MRCSTLITKSGDFNISLLFRDKYVFNKPNETNKDLFPETTKIQRVLLNVRSEPIDRLSNQNNLKHLQLDWPHFNKYFWQYLSVRPNRYCDIRSLFDLLHKENPDSEIQQHKEITFPYLKNYSADVCKETLERVLFPNYENFENPDIAYSDFIIRLDCVINISASEGFSVEIAEKIYTRQTLEKI